MFKYFPKLGEPLQKDHLDFLRILSKSCRNAIVAMTANAQSGHPGGSCSVIDYLAVLYGFIVSQTGEPVVVSNGHVSPAVYAILAEMGYVPREDVIQTFRKVGSPYEGHVSRRVPGVLYGTGPLGIGVSVASGFALAETLKGEHRRVFGLMGDGEADEGQVCEMMHFASKYNLKNYTLFMDYNRVQLSDALEKIMPLRPKAIFESADWNVIELNGHDYEAIWDALAQSRLSSKPTLLLAHTVMGKGVHFMEPDGIALRATWHGIGPKREVADKALNGELKMSDGETKELEAFRKKMKWHPAKPTHVEPLTSIKSLKIGLPRILPAGTHTDCRTAYGNALLDLAKLNPSILALTADLSGSVKTDILARELPERHFDVGIAEQHMMSCGGGLSLASFIPFVSTFGVFMTSRAKDQARVNDVNRTNVKMVATHCGLSVGEDGPTHHTLDDLGSFLGLFNTHVLEPADANQTDHLIRFIASHYGNFYVRMGRHKFNVILKENGNPFYDEKYVFKYGKADRLRKGEDVTVVAAGSMAPVAVEVADKLKGKIGIEVLAMSAFKAIDRQALVASLKKTKKLVTIEDHNPYNGWASQVNNVLAEEGLKVKIRNLAIREYQTSGTAQALYEAAGLAAKDLEGVCKNI